MKITITIKPDTSAGAHLISRQVQYALSGLLHEAYREDLSSVPEMNFFLPASDYGQFRTTNVFAQVSVDHSEEN